MFACKQSKAEAYSMMKDNKDANLANQGIFRAVVFADEKFRATRVFDELMRAFRENVPLGRHIRHFKIYSDCFIACDAVTWFLKQLNSTSVRLFTSAPSREQVVKILNMFYQPWIRLFTDVRGVQFDKLKPHFLDNRRIFRLNENFTLIQEPESLIDGCNPSPCETVHQSNAAPVCELEALRVSCASRTPMGLRLSGLQRSSSDSSLATVDRHMTSETSRYSCLELQPKCLFIETDCTRLYKQATCFKSPSVHCATANNIDMSVREVNTVVSSCEKLKASDSGVSSINCRQVSHKACLDIILQGFQELLGIDDMLKVLNIECFDVTHVISNVFKEPRCSTSTDVWPSWILKSQSCLANWNNTEKMSHALDLFKVICDYCQTWAESLFPFHYYNLIINAVEFLIRKSLRSAAVSVDLNDTRQKSKATDLNFSRQQSISADPHLSTQQSRSAYLDHYRRESTSVDLDRSRHQHQLDKSDSFDKLILNLKYLGESCTILSNDRCGGCTIPYFPPVSSSLQQATSMLGSLETAYCADSDNCMDNKSIASSSSVQLACKLNGGSVASETVDLSGVAGIVGGLVEKGFNSPPAAKSQRSCQDVEYVAVDDLTRVLQLCCLMLSTTERSRISQFFNFLNRLISNRNLVLDRYRTTRQVVLDSLSKFILGSGDNSSWNESLSSSIVDFMLDHFSIMLQIPVNIENALKHTTFETASVPLPQTSDKTTCDRRDVLADRDVKKQPLNVRSVSFCDAEFSSNVSYCEQVSREQYEKQKRAVAHDALLQLLDSIINDTTMSPKSKRHRLQQYQLSYPELYVQRCCSFLSESEKSVDNLNVTTKQSKPPLLKRSLSKLRVLRV